MAEASPQQRASLRNQCRLLLSHEEPISEFVGGVEALSASLTSTAFNPDRIRSMLSDGGEVGKLHADDIASQLDEFAENLQHQLKSLVQQPLQAHGAAIEAAVRRARAFDEAQDAHDAAKLKYLSLTKDSPLETRAYAQQDLNDRSAELSLQLFDTQRGLADACASQRIVPQRALGELMVSQLAYHQSCARLLAAAMPQVSAILEEAESRRSALEEEQRADAEVRAAMPQPQLRDEATATLAEGWLQKGTFALASGHDAVKEQLNRLKPWNKRWFVLCADGKLYYYKSAEESRSPKVPLDLNLLEAVTPVNGPLEFELRFSGRCLRLKATDPAERERWMGAIGDYLETHQPERAAVAAATASRFTPRGRGIRDLDHQPAAAAAEGDDDGPRISIEGFLHRQDNDTWRRWRKWWCAIDDGVLSLTLYESLHVIPAEMSREVEAARTQTMARSHTHAANRHSPRAAADGGGGGSPFRVAAKQSVPLTTVTVREPRSMALPFCFEVIWPQGSVVLQAESQQQMGEWMTTIQNCIATLLGTLTRMSQSTYEASVLGKVRSVGGNDVCADCGARDPSWASINVGAVVCLACAGSHRQLGTHISKVRSLELDTKEWNEPLLAVMRALGNRVVNGAWEAALPEGRKPAADASAAQREAFIRDKYERRAFVAAAGAGAEGAAAEGAEGGAALLADLRAAARADAVAAAARCLALAPRLTQQVVPGGEGDAAAAGRTALHWAVEAGSVGVVELLLQNGAAVEEEEAQGKTPLKLLAEAGRAECLEQLLTRGANISHIDAHGQTPMQCAMERKHEAMQQRMLAYKLEQDEKLLRQVAAQIDNDGHE